MGIPMQVLKLLMREDSHRPIKGRFASVGVQTLNFSLSQASEEFPAIRAIQNDLVQADAVTRHGKGGATDRELLEGLFDIDYFTIDRSDYEGASIIADMTKPIEEDLREQFDFVYSGGSLDNVFDPKTMLVNCASLLRPGGRFLSYDVSQGIVGAYLRISPEWLYSFFAVNEWIDCQVFQLHQEEPGDSRFDYVTSMYRWKPTFERNPDFDYFSSSKSHPGIHYVTAIAEKGEESSTDKIPTQLQYLDSEATDWTQMEKIYDGSMRRPPIAEGSPKRLIFDSSHYEFIEANF